MLRWWNYINDEGESTWVFESRPKEDQHRLSTTEVSKSWLIKLNVYLETTEFYHNILQVSIFLIGLTIFSILIISIFSGVNILGWPRCCSSFLGSFLLHSNLLSQAQMAGVGGEYFLFLVTVVFFIPKTNLLRIFF